MGFTYVEGRGQLLRASYACRGRRFSEDHYDNSCMYQVTGFLLGDAVFTLVGGYTPHTLTDVVSLLLQQNRGEQTERPANRDELRIRDPAAGRFFNLTAIDEASATPLTPGLQYLYDSIKSGNESFYNVDPAIGDRMGCPISRYVYNSNEWFTFADQYGVKMQCKDGCDFRHLEWQAIEVIAQKVMGRILTAGDLNADFTLCHTNSRRVVIRCKVTLQSLLASTCG
ncbi:hypothetical protein BDZ85DRAFT_246243 [Elsinoe ampelina]|uniref:Uncharacterized protein n=1 Tax=Elsinoe ampelina TaxID=302913 RepID=A0A6A6GQA2_9PEZI|nr:hypothetical protein BDZ85DRAFT_246243 [Elsinoe ampelina]